MDFYESALASAVAELTKLPEEEIRPIIKVPEPGRGDLTIPCFVLAKKVGKSPAKLTEEIASALKGDSRFEKAEAVGPYLNAYVDPLHLISATVPEVLRAGDRYGFSNTGAGRTVVIDYSSPNIAKPLGFHHLRSTMIGNALALVHRALGYEVHGINFLGDWGKTFGLLAEAFNRFGDRDRVKAEGIRYLLDLYVKGHGEAAGSGEFDEAARAMFRKQEKGDPAAIEIWEMFRSISIEEFQRIYERLGVSFELFEGESSYRNGMDELIEEIGRKAGTREDDGALVVDMEYSDGEPPMMLRKSDGATLYATRDMAAAISRWNRFEFAKSLYVVGVEQKRHFDQLKRALLKMGNEWADRMVHVHFGRVQGMSTRRGEVVFLEDVLNEARERGLAKMREAGVDREIDMETVAEQVGIGGVVFGDLKNLRASDYVFDWEEILNPKGFTGICVQYAYARCCSVLRKGGGAPLQEDVDLSLLRAPEEAAIAKELCRLPGAVQAAADDLEPSRLARAVYEVARSWNRYQQAGNADRSLRVLCDDDRLRSARLALVDATRIGIGAGLGLLGVAAPQAM